MKFITKFLLIFFLLPNRAFAADVLAQYHVWFAGAQTCPTADPVSTWSHWTWFSEPQQNPCSFIGGTTWLRNATTLTYPLIGLHKSNNTEVMRWHIQVAKAAGMTGFMVTTNPGAPEADANFADFLLMLRIASEENFKIGIETWIPVPDVSVFYSKLKSQIDQAVASPYASALMKIHNLPVVWFRFWTRWDSLANLKNNLLNTRAVFWAINGDLTFLEMASIAPTNGAEITQLAAYNFPTSSGNAFIGGSSSYVSGYLGDLHSNGYVGITHVFPSFNEALMSHDPSRIPPRYALSSGGALLGGALTQTTLGAGEYVFVESWSDHGEMTMIQPGIDVIAQHNVGQEAIYSGDPYKVLKQIATFKGVTFTAPTLSCSIVDPVLVQAGVTSCSPLLATPCP